MKDFCIEVLEMWSRADEDFSDFNLLEMQLNWRLFIECAKKVSDAKTINGDYIFKDITICEDCCINLKN